jgi:hypothetical protein
MKPWWESIHREEKRDLAAKHPQELSDYGGKASARDHVAKHPQELSDYGGKASARTRLWQHQTSELDRPKRR